MIVRGGEYPCGSEPAREKRPNNAVIQTPRVIVDAHREQARSHKGNVFDYDQRLKISEVFTPPNAKLLFITY
jgi:hypothetical protein